jgi:hypothetical protein
MAIDREFLNGLLQVTMPFKVKDVRVDEQTRRVDVWVGIEAPRSWFSGSGKVVVETRERQWRHVNLGCYQCNIHAMLPDSVELAEQSWAGDDKLGFTRAMAKQIFALLSEGVSYDGICAILEVQFEDLWKFKFALDSGSATPELKGSGKAKSQAQAAPAPIAATPATEPAAAPVPISEGAEQASGVPDVTDPVWQELAEGRLTVDIRVLSLQLMLTRLRSQFASIQDNDVRLLKLRDLHRYITKNERVLGHELSQLRGQ